MAKLVVAEKPSVARDIAAVLGARKRLKGYFQGDDYWITWAIGHLIRLPEPHEISEQWRSWRLSDLPIIPDSWPLKIIESTKDQWQVIDSLLKQNVITSIICATDAGREGELIFRYIMSRCASPKPFQRLWISSLTPHAIKAGFDNLQPGSRFDPLFDAAMARSRADWLVGMNLSRFYSLHSSKTYSIGRVQTPTLAILAKREQEIQEFKPEAYRTLQLTLVRDEQSLVTSFFRAESRQKGSWSTKLAAYRFTPDDPLIDTLTQQLAGAQGQITSSQGKVTQLKPPLLYDLTELQRRANRLWGLTATQTLQIAQNLYERHKLISYPRTNSRYLSQAVAATMDDILAMIVPRYLNELVVDPRDQPLPARLIDDGKIEDHHAIIPTNKEISWSRLTQDESRVLDLIIRRLLCQWQPDYQSRTTVVTATFEGLSWPTEISKNGSRAAADFFARGLQVLDSGFKVIDLDLANQKSRKSGDVQEIDVVIPGSWQKGTEISGKNPDVRSHTTKPPPRLNDASLLTAMEHSGQLLDDQELRKAMSGQGLGTPATRSGIIETLLGRGFISRQGKTFEVTALGMELIQFVAEEVKSPQMTAEWEAKLDRIEKRQMTFESFMKDITGYIYSLMTLPPQHAIDNADQNEHGIPRKAPGPHENQVVTHHLSPTSQAHQSKFARNQSLKDTLKSVFGFDQFRPHQEQVCQDVIDQNDVLLVMPTGAGKSLCYQLPGLARGGTTLVISPLIALIDDQVAKLQSWRLRAEAIHSGRGRDASRQVCQAYLRGELDYLFIAPERLGVNGFLQLLAKRRPALVAVDEAHCISCWGHDFRPDYRLLVDRLPQLRPSPIIGLTATATPLVQKDIAEQLGLVNPKLHIHGFRRDNIAIEVTMLPQPQRIEAAVTILSGEGRTPAIIYAPTRSACEDAADALGRAGLPALAYHAGLPAQTRVQVQESFLSGQSAIIVATVAFGMGVDKSDIRTIIHIALPSSVEGYYQEIGRAGRDGQPSRAVLFHSFLDFRQHEFFLNLNYPQPSYLVKIRNQVPKSGIVKADLMVGEDRQSFENALEKLWIHRGLTITPDDVIFPGENDSWAAAYKTQRDHREQQTKKMGQYARNQHRCRMVFLVEHFGDFKDTGANCGLCDICQPQNTFFRQARPPSSQEQSQLMQVLTFLCNRFQPISKGKLYSEVVEPLGVDRELYEIWLAALAHSQLIKLQTQEFQKDGRTIQYYSVTVSPTLRPERVDWSQIIVPDYQKAQTTAKTRTRRSGATSLAAQSKPKGSPKPLESVLDPRDQELLNRLKSWRLEEAKKRNLPAFCILPDRALNAIASGKPTSNQDLNQIPGIGPAKLKSFGPGILALIKQSSMA